MTDSLLPVFTTVGVAVVMAGGMLIATHGVDWLRRSNFRIGRSLGSRNVHVDMSPYECGMPPFEQVGEHRYSVHFYLVAMLFILFDIEAAFLWPWAVTFKEFAQDQVFVLVEMGVFLGILVIGYAYVWMRGALEWE